MGTKQAMFDAARRIEAAGTGYDQSQRWSFNPTRDGKTFVKNKEADCSAFCAAVAKSAFPSFNTADPIYTGSIRAKFLAIGFSAIRVTNSTKLSDIKAGDFVLKEGHHIEYCASDGLFYSAAIDERGKASGGTAGNQSGNETRGRSKYAYKGGWEWILRPPTEVTPSASKKSNTVIAKEVIAGKWGNGATRTKKLKAAGYDPATIQKLVNSLVTTNQTKKTNTVIAKEVIAGKWGNGATRTKKLKAAGYDPATIQRLVNSMV